MAPLGNLLKEITYRSRQVRQTRSLAQLAIREKTLVHVRGRTSGTSTNPSVVIQQDLSKRYRLGAHGIHRIASFGDILLALTSE
jgi:hypothetical protein